MRNHSGLRVLFHILLTAALIYGFALPSFAVAAMPGMEAEDRSVTNELEQAEYQIQDPELKKAVRECASGQKESADACNESSSPFAQAAMGALSALMPMLMQNQGTKQDCNKVDAAQAQASSQMGQGMPGCGGGGGPPGGGGGDKGGGEDKGGGMAGDCGKKAGGGKDKCAKAKQAASKKKADPKCQQDPQCMQDVQTAEKAAQKGEKSNEKMGSMNIGEIMKMLGQMLCQMKKAQQCQKDVCSAPGQLKFNSTDPKMTAAVPGQSKILQDDEGCMVDCNNMNYVSDPQYPEWAAKVNARITKFKPQCECMKTPSLPGCGSLTSPTTATSGTKKKDKSAASLSDENGDGNASDKTVGAMDASSPPGGGGGGSMGGGGSGIGGGKGGSDSKKDPARTGAPPGPPQVSNGYEGGGGSPSKSGGSASDDPIGKYSKFLPGRKPTAAPDAGLQITGAGGKSIWEKVSDAYRIKASSLSR